VVDNPEQLLREYRPAADPLEVIDRIVKYIARKEPGGDKYVPLNGQRDYGIGGAVDTAAFDHALSEAVDIGYIHRQAPDEAAYRLRAEGWKRFRELDAPSGAITKIFLSHAALDGELAERVRAKLTELRPDIGVFVASRPGDIPAEEDWLRVIQRALRVADAYCVLLTPNSIERPWVWFETGAAWMSDKPLVLARAAGLASREVPPPLSTRQTYSLDEPEDAREIFRALGATLANPAAFADTIRRLGADAVAAGVSDAGWEGVEVDGDYYAWRGPLRGLRDYEAEAEPPGLLEAIRLRGLEPGWARRDRLATGGRRQVFATDRLTYRRPIAHGGELFLVVSSPQASQG
jgi:hypothetical protein